MERRSGFLLVSQKFGIEEAGVSLTGVKSFTRRGYWKIETNK